MCGIAGKVHFERDRPVSADLIRRMTDAIAHRGPDGEGRYVSGPVGLGHRRLAIIDVSAAGAQPMSNEDGSVWITFNGEIYNYAELRHRLIQRGHVFRSHTDTEVIVHLWEQHGVECVEHLRGMFAFGVWDANRQSLFLARDRVGIKPLYFAETRSGLTFASEIKALLCDPDVSRAVSLEAIDRFLTYAYLPGSGTMFERIHKLDPGHYLLVAAGVTTRRQYWDLSYEPSDRFRSIDEAAEALDALVRETVKGHMISDVPVGFLASGGVDSTALLSYAVEETDKPIQTFTVGFAAADVVDERPFARLAADRFGSTHRETTIAAEDFRQFLPRYVWHMEEPVCEPPAIALHHVSALARQHVTVLVSGEGGDEAFAGYPEYRHYPALERLKSWAGPLRGVVGAGVQAAGTLTQNVRLRKYGALVNRSLPAYYYSRTSTPSDYFNAHRATLYSRDFKAALGGTRPTSVTEELFTRVTGADRVNQMLYVDTKTWLPDDLLVKADKMTMATSVELRVPFLDHHILEFAASLPVSFKLKGRATKRVLRHAFRRRVPAEILKRPKAGFPVPYGRWLTGELRDLVEDALCGTRSKARQLLEPAHVEAGWRAQTGGFAPRDIFALVVLELWHRAFVDAPRTGIHAHGATGSTGRVLQPTEQVV